MYQDDSLIIDQWSSGQQMDCILVPLLQGDSLYLKGLMGSFSGFGYDILLTSDTCEVYHFAGSDAPIYKLNPTDSLSLGVTVPCRTYSLVFTEEPKIEAGSVIGGRIELQSEEYYEAIDGKAKKYRIDIISYFKTTPLATVDELLRKINPKD